MGQIKSVGSVLLSRLVGFLIFLIIVGLLNFLVPYINNITFTSVIAFLNSSLWIIILFSVLIAGGELFSVLVSPFNLPYPLFNAIASIFLIKFLFNMLEFINNQLIRVNVPDTGITFKQLFIIITAIVFLIVLITGYVRILIEIYSPKEITEKKVKKTKKE